MLSLVELCDPKSTDAAMSSDWKKESANSTMKVEPL